MLTPASNTNLEPTTYAMLAGVVGVTAHFSRFLLPPSLDLPIDASMLADAARLLAEADVDALAFHGTAGSWTGVEGDRRLCRALESETGIPTTTATLATLDALRRLGARRVALVFPGAEWITERIVSEYARNGVEIAHSAGDDSLGSDNRVIGALRPEVVERLILSGVVEGVDAVVILGTNFPAPPLVDSLERRFDLPFVDSTIATTWKLLEMVGASSRIEGWGRLMALSEEAA